MTHPPRKMMLGALFPKRSKKKRHEVVHTPSHVHAWQPVDAGHPQRRTVQIWGCVAYRPERMGGVCGDVTCTIIGGTPDAS